MLNPTIRGSLVSITVPKRFFQKTLEVSQRDTMEAGPSAYSRFTSNPVAHEGRNHVSSIHEGNNGTVSTTVAKERLSYSPQDARSDLPKKKKGKQTQQEQTTAGSPQTRKIRPEKLHQDILPKEKPATSTEADESDALKVSTKADEQSFGLEESLPTVSVQSKLSRDRETIPSPVLAGDILKPAGTDSNVSNSNADNGAAKAASDDFPQAIRQQVDPEPQQMVEPCIKPVIEGPPKLQKDIAATASVHASLFSLESEEPASDDDLKKDLSFHSAAESQSELEGMAKPKTGSVIANHGTPIQVAKVSTAAIIPTLAPPRFTTNFAQKDIDALPEDKAAPSAVENYRSKQELKPTTMPLEASKAAVVQGATQQESDSPAISTLIEQTKKIGPQQTEALFPLSKKQLAAQTKKEREQKKKAQKKERELTQKAKAERATVSKAIAKKATKEDAATVTTDDTLDKIDICDEAKPTDDAKSASEIAVASTVTQHTEKMNTSVDEPPSIMTSRKGAIENLNKPVKHKGRMSGNPAVGYTIQAENRSEDHGKQTSGTNDSHKIGSMTNKDAKANSQESTQGTAKREPAQKSAPATDVQSSEHDDSQAISGGAPKGHTIVPSDECSTPPLKKKNNKKKKKNTTNAEGGGEAVKPPLAWPNLEFPPRSPNPAWMGPIDMETDVRNYEKIMDEACDGPDDSDYSWSDLPTMEEVMSSDEGEAPASQAGDSRHHVGMDAKELNKRKTYANAIFPEIKKLQPAMADEILSHIVNVTTIMEMAKMYVYFLPATVLTDLLPSATDNSALVSKVDEAVLFQLDQVRANSKDLLPKTTNPSNEETVDRVVANLKARIGKRLFDSLHNLSLTVAAAGKMEMNAACADLTAHEKLLAEHTGELESSATEKGLVVALGAQLGRRSDLCIHRQVLTIVAATNVDSDATEANDYAPHGQRVKRIDGQGVVFSGCAPSDTASPDSQPAKKKKPNKHKNKKKKNKSAEKGEAPNSGDAASSTGCTASTSSKAAIGPVDPKDPWAQQLREVDAIINLGQNGMNVPKASVQFHGGAATPVSLATTPKCGYY